MAGTHAGRKQAERVVCKAWPVGWEACRRTEFGEEELDHFLHARKLLEVGAAFDRVVQPRLARRLQTDDDAFVRQQSLLRDLDDLGHLDSHAQLAKEALVAAPKVREDTARWMILDSFGLDPEHVDGSLEACEHTFEHATLSVTALPSACGSGGAGARVKPPLSAQPCISVQKLAAASYMLVCAGVRSMTFVS